MQLVLHRLNGLSLLYALNLDRILAVATVILGLLAGAWLGSHLPHLP